MQDPVVYLVLDVATDSYDVAVWATLVHEVLLEYGIPNEIELRRGPTDGLPAERWLAGVPVRFPPGIDPVTVLRRVPLDLVWEMERHGVQDLMLGAQRSGRWPGRLHHRNWAELRDVALTYGFEIDYPYRDTLCSRFMNTLIGAIRTRRQFEPGSNDEDDELPDG